MVYIIKNQDGLIHCRDKDNGKTYYEEKSSIGKCGGSDHEVIIFDNKSCAETYISLFEKDHEIIEISDVENKWCIQAEIKAKLFVEMLEEQAMKNHGITLKESFDKFRKEQNKGKFLFSDLKKILDNMTPEELDEPVNIEVNGIMGPEQHNIMFSNGRTMELAGNSVKSTSDCFVLTENDSQYLEVHSVENFS